MYRYVICNECKQRRFLNIYIANTAMVGDGSMGPKGWASHGESPKGVIYKNRDSWAWTVNDDGRRKSMTGVGQIQSTELQVVGLSFNGGDGTGSETCTTDRRVVADVLSWT